MKSTSLRLAGIPLLMLAAFLLAAPLASAYDKAVVVDEPTTTTVPSNTVVVKDNEPGIFGDSPLSVVGEVLAFPFRLVGNILDGIF